MLSWLRLPRVRRFVAWLCLLLTLSACYSWQPSTAPVPESLAAAKADARIRVTLVWGNHVELLDPRLVGDSLIATVARNPVPGMERFAAALAEVISVEVRRIDAGVTSLLVFAVAAVVGTAIAIHVSLKNMTLW